MNVGPSWMPKYGEAPAAVSEYLVNIFSWLTLTQKVPSFSVGVLKFRPIDTVKDSVTPYLDCIPLKVGKGLIHEEGFHPRSFGMEGVDG